MSIRNGVYPTMITPFTPENQIDFDAVRQLVHWYHERGCQGIFAVCQSSEMFFLSLEERIALAKAVIEEAKNLSPKMDIVVSGHISCGLEEQIREINEMAALNPAAVVLVSNRLDIGNEGDDVWLKNGEKLLKAIPEDLPLGIYECPMPYKRLLSERILAWCKETGRFHFIKDTCCDASLLEKRLAQLKGSNVKLYNANAQTLLHSLNHGAAGYSGVMANFHPELYVHLCAHFADQVETCKILQDVICMTAFTECLAYPVTAKYHQNTYGVPMSLHTRTRFASHLKEYDRLVIDQMQHLAEYCKKELKF